MGLAFFPSPSDHIQILKKVLALSWSPDFPPFDLLVGGYLYCLYACSRTLLDLCSCYSVVSSFPSPSPQDPLKYRVPTHDPSMDLVIVACLLCYNRGEEGCSLLSTPGHAFPGSRSFFTSLCVDHRGDFLCC